MSELPYAPLIETDSTPRGSVGSFNLSDFVVHIEGAEHPEYLCRHCKTKLTRQQQSDHTPMECLTRRYELLENETIKLKDRSIKSRIQRKELENKIASLEEVMKGLTAPKKQQADPYSFSPGQKLRNPLKKAQTVDVPGAHPGINYDNILPPKRSSSRERLGLFGSLGASSQSR